MRSVSEARACWTLLRTQETLDDLRCMINEQHHVQHNDAQRTQSQPQKQFNPGIGSSSLRSAAWKIFLLFENLDVRSWTAKLHSSRDAFVSLRAHFLRAIDHPDEVAASIDPLSDNVDSPWIAFRKDEELRQEILLDVDRCMPDNYYFRQPETQKLLLDILLLWSKLNPDVGYRQGMHEVLAPVLWVVERDAIDPASLQSPVESAERTLDADASTDTDMHDEGLKDMFDAKYIAHDVFTLFSLIMQQAKSSYEHVARSTRPQSRDATATDTPMITRSKRIIDGYLARVDPRLAAHLRDIDIVPQVFLIRWIRLLFGREFPFDQVLALWDGLFMTSDPVECTDLVCVAMLLRIRWDLISADYNSALGLLVHYPQLSAEHPATTLLEDAIYLRENLNQRSGATIVRKYSGRMPPLVDTDRPSSSSNTLSPRITLAHPKRPAPSPIGQGTSPSFGFEALLQDAARGVYTQGERWGLNKAMRDAVGEVRKNMQGLQSRTHSRSDTTAASYHTADERPREQLKTLTARNMTLARMLESAVADLWAQQNKLAEEKAGDDPRVKALTIATAKVQLVQAYLNDAEIPLPPEEGSKETERPATSRSHLNPPVLIVETAQPVQRKARRRDSDNNSSSARLSASLASTPVPGSEVSSSAISSAASPAPLPEGPRSAEPASAALKSAGTGNSVTPISANGLGPGSGSGSTADPGSATSAVPSTPERKNHRRLLSSSDFSWMLGPGNQTDAEDGEADAGSLSTGSPARTPRSTFVSASPFSMPSDSDGPVTRSARPGKKGAVRANVRAANAFLFGDDEDDDVQRENGRSQASNTDSANEALAGRGKGAAEEGDGDITLKRLDSRGHSPTTARKEA